MNSWMGLVAAIGTGAMTACATVQPLPDEEDLPVEKIVDDAVCQTRQAFLNIANEIATGRQSDPTMKPIKPNTPFDPTKWAMSIQLQPKNTLQFDVGVGQSFKSDNNPKKHLFLVTESLAAAAGLPAANFDATGSTQGLVVYFLHSHVFFNPRFRSEFQDICRGSPATYQYDVTKNLKIEDWIRRFLSPLNGDIMELGSAKTGDNSFQYVAELTVFYGADVGTTYTVASTKWTASASLGAKRTQNMILTLSFTKDGGETVIENRMAKKAVSQTAAETLKSFNFSALLQRALSAAPP
jgi:hypothetical protein